jgi:Dynamin family
VEPGLLAASLPPGLLDELAACLGPETSDDLRARLTDIEEALGRPHVTLVFGGHFSSGKSTMINTLTGRVLLPASDFPETGVACVIRHGETERIVADTSEGLVELPFGPDALAGRVSLIGQDGGYREEIGQVSRIMITLTRSAVPPGDTWIDSPGINDTEAMTTRALEVARNADALIWIVNSRQSLPMVEEGLLRAYIAEHGIEAVAFLVNVFLRQDTAGEWDRFLADRSDYHRDRISALRDEVGSFPVAFISARAAGADAGGYGGPQARGLLAELSDPDSARIRAVRRRRGAGELDRLTRELEARLRPEQARLAADQARHQHWQAEVTGRTRAFEADLVRIITQCFDRFLPAVAQAGATLAAEMNRTPLRRDDSYSVRLSAQFEFLAKGLALELFEAIGPCAVKHGRRDLPSQAIVEFRALLLPRSVAIVVPDRAAQPAALVPRLEAVLPPGAVPATERMVGRVRKIAEKGRRTIDGARAAGKDGSTLADRVKNAAQGANAVLQADRLQVQADTIAEAEQAASQLAGQRIRVHDLVLAYCGLVGTPPPRPDEAPARVLSTLIDCLRQQARGWEPGR